MGVQQRALSSGKSLMSSSHMPHRDMRVPHRDMRAIFRKTLSHYCSGIVIVTALHDGHPVGMTCQSFFSVSWTRRWSLSHLRQIPELREYPAS